MKTPFTCVQVFVHRLRKYLGAYLLQLADVDDVVIVFSGGIGENSSLIRKMALQNLDVRSRDTLSTCKYHGSMMPKPVRVAASFHRWMLQSLMAQPIHMRSDGASPLTRTPTTRPSASTQTSAQRARGSKCLC